MKVLDINSVREPNIFDKIVFYIRKNSYKRQTIKKFNKEISYRKPKIYVSWIEPDYYNNLIGNNKMAADCGYKKGIDEISKKYPLKNSSLHSGYFEIKTKKYKIYKITDIFEKQGVWFLTSIEYNVEKNTDSGYKIDLKNVDFVNVNGELVGQSWDFTQRFFKMKEYIDIDEHHDIDYYFGDDYVK